MRAQEFKGNLKAKITASSSKQWTSFVGTKKQKTNKIKLLQKTNLFQECDYYNMVHLWTCNSNRMGRSNVDVNYPLRVEWGWLDLSVRMDLFHLIHRIWILSSCNIIQTELVEPKGRGETNTRASQSADIYFVWMQNSDFIVHLIFIYCALFPVTALNTPSLNL